MYGFGVDWIRHLVPKIIRKIVKFEVYQWIQHGIQNVG